MKKKLVLCILDGVGYREEKDFNAVKLANMPVWNSLMARCPWSLLRSDGEYVGLPSGQMGNSEVGHMTIGVGRVIKQDISLISDFLDNDYHEDLLAGKNLHLITLLSDGGVHSHVSHLKLLLEKTPSKNIFLHLITDGRDTEPKKVLEFLREIKPYLSDRVKIATICGRFYAMDRDQRWERTESYYEILSNPHVFNQAEDYIEQSYSQGLTDEFIKPSACHGFDGIQSGDTLLLMNFRADRVKQIAKLLASNENYFRFSFTEVSEYFTPLVKRQPVIHCLGEYLSSLGLRQLRIAESEKFAHITYFFNGGVESSFPGEDRLVIPSPKVRTYDLTPAMSSREITTKLEEEITKDYYDFILVNYANGDMVGHTGNLEAGIESMQILDECLGVLVNVCKKMNYHLLITADHGNVEEMSGKRVTSHSTNPVPLIIASCQKEDFGIKNGGLVDVSMTLLSLMGLEPAEKIKTELAKAFSGESLIYDRK
jgi:2,3-bisphosphoglycerate-independent phosphoglycerate mutase